MLEHELGASRVIMPIGKSDHILGNPEAPIRVIEYGDFECPFCRMAHYRLREVEPLVGDTLCFAYRHFPLSQAHPHAENAAEASEIAGAFGKFWEMHHVLYENQDALDDQSLVDYASQLGINEDVFIEQLSAHIYQKRVHTDFMSGVRSGVNGTPTLFLNEVRFEGSADDLVFAVRRTIESGRLGKR